MRQTWCRSLPASVSAVGQETPWESACSRIRSVAGKTFRAQLSTRDEGIGISLCPRPPRIAFRPTWDFGLAGGGLLPGTVMAAFFWKSRRRGEDLQLHDGDIVALRSVVWRSQAAR